MIAFRNASRNIIRTKYVLAHRVNGKLTELRIKTHEDSFFKNPAFTATGNPDYKTFSNFFVNVIFIVKTSKDELGVCTFRNPMKLYQKNVEGSCTKQVRTKGKDYFALLKPSDENLDVKRAITNDLVKNKNENKFVFDLYQDFHDPDPLKSEAFNVRPAEKSKENQQGK